MKKITIMFIAILLLPLSCVNRDDMLIKNLYAKISSLQEELAVEKEKLSILTCESGIKHDNIWGDHGKSYGIAQFQERTFKELREKAGKPGLSWKVQKDQLWLLDWSLRNGYGKYWSCYSGNK